jgi:hypothetical protein
MPVARQEVQLQPREINNPSRKCRSPTEHDTAGRRPDHPSDRLVMELV